MVRRARGADARAMGRLHASALPTAFLPTLGEGFLTQLYRELATDPSAVALVAVRDGLVTGFAAGVRSVDAFYRRFALRRGAVAALEAAPRLRDPGVRASLRETARYPTTSSELPAAELLAIGVDDRARGTGVGRALAEGVLRGLGRRGADVVQGGRRRRQRRREPLLRRPRVQASLHHRRPRGHRQLRLGGRVPFLIAAAVSLVGTAALIRVAPRIGLVDRPGTLKLHERPMPYAGAALAVGALAGGLGGVASRLSMVGRTRGVDRARGRTLGRPSPAVAVGATAGASGRGRVPGRRGAHAGTTRSVGAAGARSRDGRLLQRGEHDGRPGRARAGPRGDRRPWAGRRCCRAPVPPRRSASPWRARVSGSWSGTDLPLARSSATEVPTRWAFCSSPPRRRPLPTGRRYWASSSAWPCS